MTDLIYIVNTIFPGSSFREITSLASSIAEMSHSAFTICITKRSEANKSKKEKKTIAPLKVKPKQFFLTLSSCLGGTENRRWGRILVLVEEEEIEF